MTQPRTIYDVLSMMAEYHERRARRYRELSAASDDPQTGILLDHLVELETESASVIRGEMEHLSPDHATYLVTGPTLRRECVDVDDPCAGDNLSFDDAVGCALESDQCLTELLDRLADCTAAESVVQLAKRLREFETMKEQRIAKFARQE